MHAAAVKRAVSTDYLTFFASIIGSLVKVAWPAAAFGAVWLFRDKVADLLAATQIQVQRFR
jgi:hypothetical protein